MDAEQDVVDLVVLDTMLVAFEQEAGIDAVVQFAAAGETQAANRYGRARNGEDGAFGNPIAQATKCHCGNMSHMIAIQIGSHFDPSQIL